MRSSILAGKAVSSTSRALNRAGSTWPGHVALKLDSRFIQKILKSNPNLQIVLVAGTNGKTTTTKLIQEVLESESKKVFRNAAGANLLNGIASSLLKHSSLDGKINYDVAIFEVDENSLPLVLAELDDISPNTSNLTNHPQLSIILLNLFRDQLDRYGEVNTIAKKWLFSLQSLSKQDLSKQGYTLSQGLTFYQGVTLIVNGDDPMLTYIGKESELKTFYFGLDKKHMKKKDAPHDVDFLFCPSCETTLVYSKRSYSHMGLFKCPKCSFKHLETETFEQLPNPMFGIYNKYNINAAALLLEKVFEIKSEQVKKVLDAFTPAFGRQEKITYNEKNIFLLLSKNPTGFNQSIEAILKSSKNPNVLLLLNDRIPDGRDVSWIWDVEFEKFADSRGTIFVSGDRVYDMAIRMKYAGVDLQPTQIKADLKQAIESSLEQTKQDDTLYILATYSAMLDTRKILLGKPIL